MAWAWVNAGSHGWLGRACVCASAACGASHPRPPGATQVALVESNLLDVRKLLLDVVERERRYRAGWDFEEHRFNNDFEVDKARRRAQTEVNDWETFVDNEKDKLERRCERVLGGAPCARGERGVQQA